MKSREYNKYIQGYLYALNECAEGNILRLKIRCFQSEFYDNFDKGLLKGMYEFELKHSSKDSVWT